MRSLTLHTPEADFSCHRDVEIQGRKRGDGSLMFSEFRWAESVPDGSV